MNRCPISYEPCRSLKYSPSGLKILSRNLSRLEDFPYSAEEQRQEAAKRASKMSIQGVQPKLSVRLNTKQGTFYIVDRGGHYILKPQNMLFNEIPENEDVTMRLATSVGIEVPLHGMVYSKDQSLTYFIKRFDRIGKIGKVPVEDFAQLAGKTRDTKYDYSMEKIDTLLDQYCTFPALEKLKLFRITMFNYLIGNEDMHLKNFSLIRRDLKVELSPAYDLINTTIALKTPVEEMALPLHGKKSNFKADDFLEYFAKERLQLSQKSIDTILKQFNNSFGTWEQIIQICFLSESMKQSYMNLIYQRRKILNL